MTVVEGSTIGDATEQAGLESPADGIPRSRPAASVRSRGGSCMRPHLGNHRLILLGLIQGAVGGLVAHSWGTRSEGASPIIHGFPSVAWSIGQVLRRILVLMVVPLVCASIAAGDAWANGTGRFEECVVLLVARIRGVDLSIAEQRRRCRPWSSPRSARWARRAGRSPRAGS